MSQSQKNLPEMTMFTLRKFWVGLLLTQPIFLLIAYLRIRDVIAPNDLITNVFTLIASICLITSVILPRFIWKSAAQKISKPIQNNHETQIVSAFFLGFIIRLALLEAITQFGFAITVSSGDVKMIIPFALVSILGFLLNFPTKQKIIDCLVYE